MIGVNKMWILKRFSDSFDQNFQNTPIIGPQCGKAQSVGLDKRLFVGRGDPAQLIEDKACDGLAVAFAQRSPRRRADADTDAAKGASDIVSA